VSHNKISSESMNSKLTVCFLLIILMSPSLLTITQADIWDPFHSKQEKTQMWKTLWENHANHANTEYFPVGKTYNGTDILMFTAGNPYGGRILWDGELHGNEDKGSELLYLMAQWLLESNDPQATTILQNNYLMFIPQVNIQDTRGNGDTTISSYGVDLNRNFQTGWTKANPNDDIYSGPNPLSEPETRVMRTILR
jgi:murein tripeptide amidase MpaA